MSRGKNPLLQLYHLNSCSKLNNIDNDLLTVPLLIRDNVPLVEAEAGKIGLSLIIDSGSPCNLAPYSFLKEFEDSSGFQCVRFENQMKLQAHNSNT